MKLIFIPFILLIIIVTACTSGEIKEVVLTPSEQGTLKLSMPTQSELAELGLKENPGYVDLEMYLYNPVSSSEYNDSPKSMHLALYQKDETSFSQPDLTIMTLVLNNSKDADEVLEELFSMLFSIQSLTPDETGSGPVLPMALRKGNTVVLLGGDISIDLASISDKLSQRLGMEIVDRDQLEIASTNQ